MSIEDLFGNLSGLDDELADDRRQVRGQDLESELTVELEDVFFGRTKSIQLDGAAGVRCYDVKLPRGIRGGEKIRQSGQGLNGHNRSPGDLYLTIRVAPHPVFRVELDDLVTDLAVSAWDAALGGKARVQTLEGEVTLTLPRGLSSGQRLRLKGKVQQSRIPPDSHDALGRAAHPVHHCRRAEGAVCVVIQD